MLGSAEEMWENLLFKITWTEELCWWLSVKLIYRLIVFKVSASSEFLIAFPLKWNTPRVLSLRWVLQSFHSCSLLFSYENKGYKTGPYGNQIWKILSILSITLSSNRASTVLCILMFYCLRKKICTGSERKGVGHKNHIFR